MSGPLTGLKVVELAAIGPAPFCATLLADLGADVIRVDRTADAGIGINTEQRFNLLSRGRRSIAIDMKQADGVSAVLRLIDHADVLIEGFRPGVAERLGVGPDVCLARNDKLVYGRMTGWGQDGPLAAAAGHDINYIALTGALHAIGRDGAAPTPPLNLVGDFGGGGMFLAFGILAAIFAARQSGKGQVVDAAMIDGAAYLMLPIYGLRAGGHWPDARGRNILDSGAPFYDVYETKDHEYVAIGAIEAKFYALLLQYLELDPATLPAQWDRRQWPHLRQIFADRFRRKSRQEWVDCMENTDICFAPVLSMAEAPDHPHNQARANFVEVAGIRQPAPAPRFSETPAETPTTPPEIGRHSREILAEAGLSDADIDRLISADVVLQA